MSFRARGRINTYTATRSPRAPVSGYGKYEEHHEVFGSFTAGLKKLALWLKDREVRREAMESTGVYWRPVWNVLERYRCLDLLLVNPTQVRALNGHKTDRIDAARIAGFLHGRLTDRFIPPVAFRDCNST